MMALILSVALMVAAGILSLELWGWLPALSRWVIWLVTLSLPRERRTLRRREFGEELKGHYAERRVAGLAWTLRLTPVCFWERATSSALRWRAAGLMVLSAVSFIVLDPQALGAVEAYSEEVVVLGGLGYVYVCHHRSFHFVRNMLAVVLTVGAVHMLGERVAVPLVHPFLVSETFMRAALHAAFALVIAWPLARLVRRRVMRVLWLLYPFGLVMVALIATADGEAVLAAFTGALISGIAADTARRIARLSRTPA
jgi:hypothetical protein